MSFLTMQGAGEILHWVCPSPREPVDILPPAIYYALAAPAGCILGFWLADRLVKANAASQRLRVLVGFFLFWVGEALGGAALLCTASLLCCMLEVSLCAVFVFAVAFSLLGYRLAA